MEIFELRMMERIIVVLIGGLCIYLGYKLFLNLPEQRDSEGKILLPGNISAYFSRVGPGVFFALFGALVISLSLYQGIEYERKGGGDISFETIAGAVPLASNLKQSAANVSIADRLFEVESLIRRLNQIPSYIAVDLDPESRDEAEHAILEAKLELMKMTWFAESPADFERFSDLARSESSIKPDDAFAEHLAVFRRGMN
jgi:hypothetical protein